MNKEQDLFYMKRCHELAKRALGSTYPNPLVGSIIVHDNVIIGKGWHKQAGGAHAEVNAINQVINKNLLKKSTLYVNLEPCSHFGKTPPCSDLIISSKIPRVVIGSNDPNPKVAGNGIKKLKAAGCEVVTHVLQKESDFLNRRFFTFHKKKRPYVILKWAQTKDSLIAPLSDKNKKTEIFWISNSISKQQAHQWRSEEAAILVGVQTVVNDNPKLTTREWAGKNPLRLIIDPSARTPVDSSVHSDSEPTIFFTNHKTGTFLKNKKYIKIEPFSIEKILQNCYENEIQSIIVEGGLITLQKFIDAKLWDEARIFSSNKELIKGVKAPKINKAAFNIEKNDTDTVSIYFN